MASEGDRVLELRCKKTERSKIVNVNEWPAAADPDSQIKRSDIIHTIIQYQRADLLEKVIELGWDPNELLIQPRFEEGWNNGKAVCWCRNDATSALREAAWNLWTDGVRLILDAGADSNFNPEHWTKPLNPLEIAVHREKPEMVKVLLEKGADPNIRSRDQGLAMEKAVINCVDHQYDTRIVQLLFEYGSAVKAKDAMDHITFGLEISMAEISNKMEDMEDIEDMAYKEERQQIVTKEVTEVKKASAALLELIVNYGPDVTKWNANDSDDLIYNLINMPFYDSEMQFRGIFFQEHLDLVYRYGGYTDDADVLSIADAGTHSNIIRWLIRHGADTTSLKQSMLVEYLYPDLGGNIKFEIVNEIPLILVQSGNRLPSELRSFLIELDKLIAKPLALDEDAANDVCAEVRLRIHSYKEYHKNEKSRFTKIKPTLEQRLHQAADLEEFSDISLCIYPESECHLDLNGDPRDMLQNTSSNLAKVLNFISQPLSLQWWCRHYMRNSLVSLHPFVVKRLPGPAGIKRFILCHEL